MLTLAEEQAWKAQVEFCATLVAEKRSEIAGSTPAEVSRRASFVTLFATDRAAVEALVREDPGVKAGVVAFEIIAAEE